MTSGILLHYRTLGSYMPGDTMVANFMAAAGLNTAQVYYQGTMYERTGQQIFDYLHTFIQGLKNNGLWDKILALYPMIGGTARSHSINLKNPTAFALTYPGTPPVQAPTGMDFDGSSMYARTNCYPSRDLPFGQGYGIDYYSREAIIDFHDSCDMGYYDTGSPLELGLNNGSVGHHAIGRSGNGNLLTGNNTTSLGFFSIDRNMAGQGYIYQNAQVVSADQSGISVLRGFYDVWIGGLNVFGSLYGATNRECALACIRHSIANADISIYYQLVQNLQTSLGRQV